MVDLHNDFLTKLSQKNIQLYLKNNKPFLDKLMCPVFTTELKNPLKFIKKSKKILKNYDFCDICIEDIGFLEKIELQTILNLKPKYVGLTWNNDNKFAGGAYGNSRLTTKGKSLINIFEKQKILIDTAHLNYKSFCDIVQFAQKPIICSHTGFYDIVKDKRNLTKSQIKDIIQKGGIIGLFFVGKYISNNRCDIYEIAKNINYFTQNFGTDNLCIGSDFYGTNDLPMNLKTYAHMSNLTSLLKKIGYKEFDIKKIFKLNAIKFFEKFTD